MRQLLIIGGSDAGISAALRAREVDPTWSVRLVVADRFPNYSICGLPFYLSGETPRWESLAHRTRQEIEDKGIELLLGTVAERLDPAGHRVQVREASGAVRELTYDRIVVATGATPAKPPIRGLEAPSVYLLHTMADSFAVHERLSLAAPRSAIIVGAGYIGLEMADALRHRGLEVTVFETVANVLQTVEPELGRRVQTELEQHGVHVRLGVPIDTVERAGESVAVTDREGRRVQADLVLVATGVRPSVEVARATEIRLRVTGDRRTGRLLGAQVLGAYGAEISKRIDVFATGDLPRHARRRRRAPGPQLHAAAQ